MREVNTREGEELLKIKDNIGSWTNGCKRAMNKFKQKNQRRFLIVRAVRFWMVFQPKQKHNHSGRGLITLWKGLCYTVIVIAWDWTESGDPLLSWNRSAYFETCLQYWLFFFLPSQKILLMCPDGCISLVHIDFNHKVSPRNCMQFDALILRGQPGVSQFLVWKDDKLDTRTVRWKRKIYFISVPWNYMKKVL